ncbi:RICIN domain-containing protein [Actinosynnema sp. NPDC020468]|uniref:RICIN domain-containing protein n=1 Tax=Actinosynnema sp. NPDC020468 TaxID=3154488 RepID=UPI0033DBA862
MSTLIGRFVAVVALLSATLLTSGGVGVAAPGSPLPAEDWRSRMNNKCLEILSLDNSNGAHVGTWDCWGGANQKWYWGNDGEIRSRMNNKCLEILSLNNANGAHVGAWDCWGGANQKWYIGNDGEIRSRMNNKCLEILSLNNANGAHAGTWDCWGGANQKWYPF